MKKTKLEKDWDVFGREFCEVIRRNRLMQINFDFRLPPASCKEDVKGMHQALNMCLKAIKEMEENI